MRPIPWRKALKTVISACKGTSSVAKTHALIITSGAMNHNTFHAPLVALYARVGDIESARKVFDKLAHRRIDAWNAIIIAYSRKDQLDEVVNLYHRMISEGVKPDSSTFTVTIKACTSLSDLERGEEIRVHAFESGYGDDLFVASSLLNLYAKCEKIDEAISVFARMRKRDLISWTMMVTGLAKCGRAFEAIDVYRKMGEEGMEGDGIVMLGLIQASCDIEDKRIGLSIHGYMIRKNLPMDVVVLTSLVDMYSKIGNLCLASRVFENMHFKNVISWSALISGYAQNGFALDALDLLRDMQNFRLEPDIASLVSSILCCSHVGFLKLGRSIHGYVVRRYDLDGITGTSMIDMYSKCGCLSNARLIFDRMSHKDLICWNTMIASYGIHGYGREAISLFLRMREEKLKPDHATFSSLLSASSHAGLVEEGRYWFDLMVNEFHIQPSEKHYACMVDLLARAGKLEEACSLIDGIGHEPGLAVWVALLSGCQIHRNFFIGELAAKKISKFNPNEPGIYTLVSNFFATATMWGEVAEVRRAMKETGIKKVPGYSSVEVNRKVHAFIMEDKSHPRYEHIIEILIMLEYEMRDMSHIIGTKSVYEGLE